MIPDFQNFSITKCKELVMEYQKNQDPKIFNILLARYDRYILFLINNYKKYTSFLYSESPQELYHTGIVGFHKGLLSFKPHLSPHMLVLRISSYVVAELRQTYIYKIKELQFSHNLINLDKEELNEFYPSVFEKYEQYTNKLSVSLILSSSCLTPHEKKLLEMKYIQGLTFQEIAKKESLAYSTVHIHVTKALNKLKKRIRNTEKEYQ